MLKRSIFITAIIILFFSALFFLAAKSSPFQPDDLYALLKTAFILALFFASAKERGGLTVLLRKGLILLAALAMINRGFYTYSLNSIGKSMIFLWPGIFLIFVFFYLIDETAGGTEFAAVGFKEESVYPAGIKILIAFALAGLGVFFININYLIPGLIAYCGAITQLLLVFRVKSAVPGTSVTIQTQTIMTPPRKGLFLMMLAASFLFYYLALKYLFIYSIHISLIYFLLGSVLFGMVPEVQTAKIPAVDGKKEFVFDIIFCVFLFALGIFLYSRRLMQIPPGIHGDETVFLKFAKAIGSGIVEPVYISDPVIQGPALYSWLIAMAGKLFGITIFTGRWMSILVSSFMLVLVYLTVKELFKRRAAVIASLFLSCFFMTLLYSRISIPWLYTTALGTAGFYMMLLGLKKGKTGYFLASGILLGLNLYFYNASKIEPLFFVLYPATLLLRKETRQPVMSNWKNFAVLYISAVIVYLPIIYFAVVHRMDFVSRVGAVSLFQKFPPAINEYYNFFQNIINQSQMFFTRSADGYCHNLPGKPFFDPLTGYFSMVGIGFLAFTWKKERSAFINAWLITGMLAAYLSHLGPEDPFPSRTVLALPAVMITIALGIEMSWRKIESLWPAVFKIVLPLCAAFAFAWFAFYNLHNFFVVYPKDPHTQTYYRSSDKIIADYLVKNRNKHVLLSSFFTNNFYFTFEKYLDAPYWSHDVTLEDPSLFDISAIYDDDKRDVAIIGEGIYHRFLPIYSEYFPHAEIRTLWDTNFWQFDTSSNIKYCYEWRAPDRVIALNNLYNWFYVYDPKVPFVKMVFAEIPQSDIDTAFSLRERSFIDAKEVDTSVEGSVFRPDVKSIRTVISGLIYIPEYKQYEFKLVGARGTVYIDSAPANGAMMLYQGLHRISAVVGKSADISSAIQWKTADASGFEEIPRKYLLNSDKIYGLLADYSQDGHEIYKQLEPVVDYRIYWFNLRPGFKAVKINKFNLSWSGYIQTPEPGKYEFKFEALCNSRINVGGQTVYEKNGKDEKVIPIYAGKARQRISVVCNGFSYDPAGDQAFRLLYRKTGQKLFEEVTYDMLSPGI